MNNLISREVIKGGVDERGKNPNRKSVEDLPSLCKTNVRKLPVLREADQLYGSLGKRMVDGDNESKALQAVRVFGERFSVLESDIKPCVAYIYLYGVDSYRKKYAFLLALSMHTLGISREKIEKALEDFNTRLTRPLKLKEIKSVIKSVDSGRYNKEYRCDHSLLTGYCIGRTCPWNNIRGKTGKKPVISELMASDWFKILDPYAFKILCGLHRLRMLRGYPPDAKLIFNYSQLVGVTGLTKSSFSNRLQNLANLGLITDLQTGTGWGTGQRGSATSLRFVWPLPKPPSKFA